MDFRQLRKWSKTIGRRGENYACRLLTDEHCHVLLRNYRPASGGELDIVARDGATLVFVEVKTRFHRPDTPAEKVLTPGENLRMSQKRRILRGARSYLRELNGLLLPYRIDLIEVVLNRFGVESALHHKRIIQAEDVEEKWQQK